MRLHSVRDSAQKLTDRKISCRNGDSNPRQYCARLFSRTLPTELFRPRRPGGSLGVVAQRPSSELRSCVKVEVDVLGFRPYGFCGRKATLQQQQHPSSGATVDAERIRAPLLRTQSNQRVCLLRQKKVKIYLRVLFLQLEITFG